MNEKATYKYCLDRLRGALERVGVMNFRDFGEHSDRVGAASLAANEGISTDMLQVQGRWASEEMPKRYHKKSKQKKRLISNLFNRV